MKQPASEGKQERNLYHLKTTYLHFKKKKKDPLNKHNKVSIFILKDNILTAQRNGKQESLTILVQVHPPTEKGKKKGEKN